jgi:hypothetical protein
VNADEPTDDGRATDQPPQESPAIPRRRLLLGATALGAGGFAAGAITGSGTLRGRGDAGPADGAGSPPVEMVTAATTGERPATPDEALARLGALALASAASHLANPFDPDDPDPVDPVEDADDVAFRAAVDADLRAGRVVRVDGWILAATEARLCLAKFQQA